MFGNLDWPINASCGIVSISWASCMNYCDFLLMTHGMANSV